MTNRILFLSFSVLALACDEFDPEAGEDMAAVEDDELAAETISVHVIDGEAALVQGDADLDPQDALDPLGLAAIGQEPLAGSTAKSFCTSWNLNCTEVSVNNSAAMPASKEVWIGAKAYHTNDSVNFYWAHVEHHIYDYSNTKYHGTKTCPFSGDWAKKYYLPCTVVTTGLSGYTIRTRVCADIKDDGKGKICTNFAYAKAVW